MPVPEAGAEARGRVAGTEPNGSRTPDGLGTTIVRNAVFTVGGRMFLLLAWAAVTPYMLGVLGDERFAIWALFFAISGYFIAFDLGVSQALVKFVAQHTAAGDARALRGMVTLGSLLYLGLTAPVVAGLALFRERLLDAVHTPVPLRAEAGWCLVAMGIVLGASNLVGVMTAVLTGRQRMDVTNRILVLGTVLQVGGGLVALANGWGIRGLVLSYGAGVAVMGVISWLAVRRVAPEVGIDLGSLRREQIGELLHFSAALQVTNLGTFLQLQLPKFLLAHFASLAMVARYELALRLALAAWAIPVLLLQPLVPAMSHLGSLADHDRILRLYARSSRYVAAVSFPIAGFVLASAPALVTAWLGPGYPEAAWGAAGLIGFLLISILGGVAATVCRGIGMPWLEARFHVLGGVLLVGASLALVPRWGLAGALVALGFSGAIMVALFLWRFHARIGQPLLDWVREALAVPFAASAVATALAILWRGGFSVSPAGRWASLAEIGRTAAVFAVVVGAAYLATRFVTVAELRDVTRGAPLARSGPDSALDGR